MGERRGVYRVLVGNLKERDRLEDPGGDGRIILRWIFRKWGHGLDRAISGQGQVAGTCECGNETSVYIKKGKAVPLQAWSSPESFRKLRFPDFMTTAQDGGKVVSLTHRQLYPQEMLLVLISVRV